MMFLVESNLLKVTKLQYSFKLKAYFQLFFNLVIFQIIGIILSLVASSSQVVSSGATSSVKISVYYSAIVTVLTFIMLFSIAFIVQTEKYKNLDIAIVGNRYSSSFSDIAYIITLCIFAGITTSLSGVFLRVVFYFTRSSANIVGEGFFISPKALFIGMISAALYAVLISSLGYLIGALAQINKVFSIIIPGLIIGSMFLILANQSYSNTVAGIRNFYAAESSVFMFIIKIVVTSAILFTAAVKIVSNLEVRR